MNKFLRYSLLLMITFVSSWASAQDAKDTISIISFNDFHGMFLQDQHVPGAAALVGTVNSLRKNNPNAIVVSGGDNFSGSYFSLVTRGQLISPMFKHMNVELTAIGNHEFDWGLPYLKDTLATTIPVIAANVNDANMKGNPWFAPYKIIERKMHDGKMLRIAFVGLTTTASAYKSKPGNLRGITFENPTGAFARTVLTDLRQKEKNVDMIIIVMHIGTNEHLLYPIEETNAEGLPFVDGLNGIVSAHSHEVVLDKINNVPIIQAGMYSNHVAMMRFLVRSYKGNRDISFLDADTVTTQSKLADAQMQKEIDNVANSMKLYEHLTYSKDDMIHDSNVNYYKFTGPGAYIAQSYAYTYSKMHPNDKRPVIGANHFRGIRASIFKGDLTYIHAANLLPFGGKAIAYQFTGASLLKFFTIGRNSESGYMQTSGLTMKVNDKNQVTNIWYKGKEIKPDEECVLVTDSYIAASNPYYSVSFFAKPIAVIGETTEVFTNFLRTQPFLSLKNASLPVIRK